MKFLSFDHPILAATVLLLVNSHVHAADWRWIVSTDTQRWVEQPAVHSATADIPQIEAPTSPPSTEPFPSPEQSPQPPLTVVIDPNAVAQQVDGWGGCFNEIGWRALLRLDAVDRESVLRALFDEKDGLGLNIGRMPIGSSDFALSPYSYDDVPGDFELKHFSIDRDRFMLIPYIKAALAIRPDLKIWGSPWSPPGWMKTSGVYHSGNLKREPAIFQSYANYLARFVEAYKAEGIDIAQVHVQNEPTMDTKYPSCQWLDPTKMRDFIRDYAAPVWAERKVPAQLWLGTITNGDYKWFKAILDDPQVLQAIGGVGLQYEGRKVAANLRRDFPSLSLMETETRCYNGANSWAEAEDTFSAMQQFIRGGCSAYCYWNLVLDETGRSTWGWAQDSTIVVSQYDGSIIYTPQFFLMKHLSVFVKPGSRFLTSTNSADPVLAYKAKDGAVIAVLNNTSRFDRELELHVGEQSAKVTLPPHSFSTFVCEK